MSNQTAYDKTIPSRHDHLRPLGWDDHLEAYCPPDGPEIPARVTGVHRGIFTLSCGGDEFNASPSGRLRHGLETPFPVAGDWVLTEQGIITRVLPRKNALARGASGTRGGNEGGAVREQVMAANIDHLFIVCGLDRDFNLRRIERYVTLAYECGLSPVVVLTKADLYPAPQATDPEVALFETESVAPGVSVHTISVPEDKGVYELYDYLGEGRTIALIGSSGAGKSTLVNALLGTERQKTATVGDKVRKGRHTTTSRDLIQLPGGGMLIDNPGIREIALWTSGDPGHGTAEVFADIEALAEKCRFRDCSHTGEPGCRVRSAVESGALRSERLESYLKMQREAEYLSQRKEKSANRVEKERFRGISLRIKEVNKREKRR